MDFEEGWGDGVLRYLGVSICTQKIRAKEAPALGNFTQATATLMNWSVIDSPVFLMLNRALTFICFTFRSFFMAKE